MFLDCDVKHSVNFQTHAPLQSGVSLEFEVYDQKEDNFWKQPGNRSVQKFLGCATRVLTVHEYLRKNNPLEKFSRLRIFKLCYIENREKMKNTRMKQIVFANFQIFLSQELAILRKVDYIYYIIDLSIEPRIKICETKQVTF